MNLNLRDKQGPIKERYREDADASNITLTARGSTDDVVSCSVDIGRAIQQAEAHEGVAGPGTGACSGDLLLGARGCASRSTRPRVIGKSERFCTVLQTLLQPPEIETETVRVSS